MCFFSGMLLIYILDHLLHKYAHYEDGDYQELLKALSVANNPDISNRLLGPSSSSSSSSDDNNNNNSGVVSSMQDDEIIIDNSGVSSNMISLASLRNTEGNDDSNHSNNDNNAKNNNNNDGSNGIASGSTSNITNDVIKKKTNGGGSRSHANANAAIVGINPNTAVIIEEKTRLRKMSLITAVAIGLHNIPEGSSTFVASLEDISLGFTLAFAIALHNIPEGICVGMPVYFATGSKWKAFLWSALAGMAEPFGGLIGYLALDQNFSDQSFGIVFGIVAGIMVQICVQELIPQAFRNDPMNTYTTASLVAGFVVMSASLLLFL